MIDNWSPVHFYRQTARFISEKIRWKKKTVSILPFYPWPCFTLVSLVGPVTCFSLINRIFVLSNSSPPFSLRARFMNTVERVVHLDHLWGRWRNLSWNLKKEWKKIREEIKLILRKFEVFFHFVSPFRWNSSFSRRDHSFASYKLMPRICWFSSTGRKTLGTLLWLSCLTPFVDCVKILGKVRLITVLCWMICVFRMRLPQRI